MICLIDKQLIKKILFKKINNLTTNMQQIFNRNSQEKIVEKLIQPEGALQIGGELCGEKIINENILIRTYYIKNKGYINYIYFQQIKDRKKRMNYLIVFDKDKKKLQQKTNKQIEKIKNINIFAFNKK